MINFAIWAAQIKPYLVSTYFWVTSGIAIVVSFVGAYLMD